MITVIIAGGSGTRLWPLSTNAYPKHLLKVAGDSRSLLQNTFDRVQNTSTRVYVITDSSHSHHVIEQLPELDTDSLIIEPARRGTASCILAGLERIACHCDNDEPIAFVAADHFIRDGDSFSQSFRRAEKTALDTNQIVLIGIEPEHPAVGFGYIEKGPIHLETNQVYSVAAFHEKPDLKTAKKYLQAGNYLWNCGYFVATPSAFRDALSQHAPDLADGLASLISAKSADEYQAIYLGFENIAIDYALIEKVPNLLVVPATFDWKDLGSYADIHKSTRNDTENNHVLGGSIELDSVSNSFIENHENKPLVVIGLSGVVVVNTPNGIIVADKDMSQALGVVAKRIQSEPESLG